METNPYSPSKANLQEGPPQPGSPLKAVVVGFFVDLGGTMAAGIVIGLVYALYISATVPEATAAQVSLTWPGWLTTATSLIGLGFSVLGGYCCARIVRRDEYRWGGVLAACVFVAGILLSASDSAPEEDLFLGAVSIIGTMFGAHLGRSSRSPPG